MYLYLNREGGKFWSQESPTEDDLQLIQERALCVYCNYGGSFVQLDVVQGKVVYAEVAKGQRMENVEHGQVYTVNSADTEMLTRFGRWLEVSPRIPIGPSGMKQPS